MFPDSEKQRLALTAAAALAGRAQAAAANIELRDRVGADNFFLFGLDAPQAAEVRRGDYRSYLDAQDAAAAAWRDPARWTRMSICNSAHCGFFSSDRTVADYNARIWQVHAGLVARALIEQTRAPNGRTDLGVR
jgi:glucan phosphorylase